MSDNTERYIGYATLLELPSGRVGLQVTINQVEELLIELQKLHAGKQKNVKVLVLPVKPENVNEWRTHSVKIGESKYKQDLIKNH